jgi:hypothetical protein
MKNQGAGLGLHIVHRLCSKINGNVHLESKQDRGTTANVYIDCKQTKITQETFSNLEQTYLRDLIQTYTQEDFIGQSSEFTTGSLKYVFADSDSPSGGEEDKTTKQKLELPEISPGKTEKPGTASETDNEVQVEAITFRESSLKRQDS